MKTLDEFAKNPGKDTYDGKKVIQWLFEATTGKKMSDEEADGLVKEAYEKAISRKSS